MKETMTDKLIDLMKQGYVTPLTALKEAGCLSLSQRAGDLIRQGMKVEKRRVELENGKHVMSYHIPG